MTEFEPYIVWGEGKTEKVPTLRDLDRLVGQLIQLEGSKPPIGVQIIRNDRSGLLITLGHEFSHVEFFSSETHPQVVGCRGPWNDSTLIGFTFGGEYTEMEKRFFVSAEDARDAMHEYYQTGNKPKNIRWSDE